MSFSLILLAAGDSKRLGSKVPKPFIKIGKKTLLEYSLIKFNKIRQIKKIIIVTNKKHSKFFKNIKFNNCVKIVGGKTRQESTYKALKHIKKNKIKCTNVLIHDSARPNFSVKLIKRIINASKRNAVIPKIPMHDALKESIGKKILLNLPRKNFFSTQTPQSFNFNEILDLHSRNKALYKDDDLSLVQSLKKVKFVNGEKNNFKITNQEDLSMLKNFINLKTRTGIGFDVHRLVPKRKLYLAGLRIKSHLGTLGHSDGDPVLHSIIDAILGACKMGDIGQMFSDKNKRFKNIRSTILLKRVMDQIKSKGYYVNNLDINIITQTPKIKKYKNKMIDNISKLCEISKDQINIKGKTTEKLGVIGKEKAIACEVIASVIKYD
ncbi:MAG: 2-C-methyl-D-erythritol 2,4-cyclodiphosphate synthase [Pelagibacteraceae bacterium]|nr:2-C-methyl-D-erythritol 2,4-cyclodiphosphate synthase [Pelagibacteraceae bacterium]MBO6485337.1 2-C-methyl-D-erythritol 2,4-cyclodiphosphate synthase [Pelagibacteraceae bacterium]